MGKIALLLQLFRHVGGVVLICVHSPLESDFPHQGEFELAGFGDSIEGHAVIHHAIFGKEPCFAQGIVDLVFAELAGQAQGNARRAIGIGDLYLLDFGDRCLANLVDEGCLIRLKAILAAAEPYLTDALDVASGSIFIKEAGDEPASFQGNGVVNGVGVYELVVQSPLLQGQLTANVVNFSSFHKLIWISCILKNGELRKVNGKKHRGNHPIGLSRPFCPSSPLSWP